MDYYGNLDRPVGLVFANMTWGTEDRNITVNIGTGTKVENGLGEVFAYTDSTEYVESRAVLLHVQHIGVRPRVGPSFAGEHPAQ